LQQLELVDTEVSEQAVADLQTQLPRLRILR